MIKGRTPNIRTDQLRAFANKLVASNTGSDKYGRKSISKAQFNKFLQHADFEHASTLRSGRKMMTTHETKKFLGNLLEKVQADPNYKVSTFARKALNVRLHQGDNLIENFDPEHVGEKGLSFVAKLQQEEDAKANSGPSPEEVKMQERRERARKYLNLYRSKQERDDLASGKKSLTPTSVTTGQEQKSATSATSHEGAGTIAGKSQVAGAGIAQKATSIASAANTRPSEADAPLANTVPQSPVHLASGLSLGRVGKAPSHPDTRAIPAVGAPDTRTPASKEPGPADLPDEESDAQLPDTSKVDESLPFQG